MILINSFKESTLHLGIDIDFFLFLKLSTENNTLQGKKIIKKLAVFISFLRFGAVWEGILWRSLGVLDGLETS